jgi:hypothetical protein
MVVKKQVVVGRLLPSFEIDQIHFPISLKHLSFIRSPFSYLFKMILIHWCSLASRVSPIYFSGFCCFVLLASVSFTCSVQVHDAIRFPYLCIIPLFSSATISAFPLSRHRLPSPSSLRSTTMDHISLGFHTTSIPSARPLGSGLEGSGSVEASQLCMISALTLSCMSHPRTVLKHHLAIFSLHLIPS